MIINLLSSELVSKPWPLVCEEHLFSGYKHEAMSKCHSCRERYCSSSNLGFGKCRYGVGFYVCYLDDYKLAFPEYVLRKGSRERSVFPDVRLVNDWVDKLNCLNHEIAKEVVSRESNILHSFHDAFKWASQVNIMAEKLLSKEGRGTFRDNLDSASSELKSIYKCSGLLVQSANATEIYLNPESASYGEKVNTRIYQLFDKVQAIIYHGQGKRDGKRFKLLGTSFKSIDLYESFPVVALCLLQNAIKYSMSEEVEIFVEDVPEGVEVRVVSVGPIINRVECDEIFDKGVRGQYASKISDDGMGVGLYVAQCVARKNGFEIGVNSQSLDYGRNGIPMAQNTFYFTVPS